MLEENPEKLLQMIESQKIELKTDNIIGILEKIPYEQLKALENDEFKLKAIELIEYYEYANWYLNTSNSNLKEIMDKEYRGEKRNSRRTRDYNIRERIERNHEYEYLKAYIATTLKSDNDKIELSKNFESDIAKMNTYKSIKDDELKMQVIDSIGGNTNRTELAVTLKSDELKIRVIDSIEGEENKVKIAETLKSDNAKIKAIELLEGDFDRRKIADMLNSDELKMQIIDSTEDEWDRIGIAETLKSDKLKMQIIDSTEDEWDKEKIAETLTSDELKMKVIGSIEDEKVKTRIAETLKSDKLKMQVIDSIESEWNKGKIAETIESDNIKIRAIELLEDVRTKKEIALTLKSGDEAKIKVIELLEYEWDKCEIAVTLNSDELKIQIIDLIEDEWNRSKIAKTLKSDELKMQVVNSIEDKNNKGKIAETLNSEKLKLQVMTLMKKENKNKGRRGHSIVDEIEWINADIANTLESDEVKIKAIELLEDDRHKSRIAKTLKNDEAKIEAIGLLNNEVDKINIAQTLKSKESKLKVIELAECTVKIMFNFERAILLKMMEDKELTPNIWKRFRKEFPNVEFVKNNFEKFMIAEGKGEKELEKFKNIIFQMYEKNEDIVRNIDSRYDIKKIELLGEDKVNLISCYPNIQEQIIQLDDKKFELLSKIIKTYEENNTGEWTIITQKILENISRNENNELINNIEEIEQLTKQDISNMTEVLQNNKWLQIKNIQEVKDYRKICESKCNEIINKEDATIKDKKEAVIQKLYGHNMDFAYSIITRFGDDIENIDDGENKDYVRVLKELVKTEDEDMLEEIFKRCEFAEIEKFSIERNLKSEYGKKFNEGLYNPQKEDCINEKSNIYEVGTDFKMIITAIGAYSHDKPFNYKDNWNRPTIASQQFCASYIRNDMIGTAPRRNICYGFSQIEEDSLALSGVGDIYSSKTEDFVVKARRHEMYYTPNEQINKTVERYNYNEMDFKRSNKGVRIQPDYIVVFRNYEEIDYMEEALKAQKEWGDIPIVIVDIEQCLYSESQKIDKMIEEYERNPNLKLEEQIIQKVRNNRKTYYNNCVSDYDYGDEGFYEGVEGYLDSIIEEMEIEQHKEKNPNDIGIEQLETNYENVSAKDREEIVGKLSIIYREVKQIREEMTK